jgi:hypothetical protein
VAGDDPEVRFRAAYLHAKRTGDHSKMIARLRETKSKRDSMIADVFEGAKLKRPRQPSRPADPWVRLAVLQARLRKLKLHIDAPGRRSKRGENIDDTVIKLALTDMREHGCPMRPNKTAFETKVRNKLRRSQPRKGGDDFATMLADFSAEVTELGIDLRAARADRASKK